MHAAAKITDNNGNRFTLLQEPYGDILPRVRYTLRQGVPVHMMPHRVPSLPRPKVTPSCFFQDIPALENIDRILQLVVLVQIVRLLFRIVHFAVVLRR